ncbi:MAG: pYEATS domain-containing protein [Methylobacter sp.]
MNLHIKQDFDYQGDERWLWSLGVYGQDNELDRISFVRYTLPPIFLQPSIKSTDRDLNFRIFEEAYEEFRIYVKVVYKDGEEKNLEHDLKLAKISVKSECQKREDETWDWGLSIEGTTDEELGKIQSVTYQLHKKKRTTRNRKSGFRIEGSDCGIIPVLVDVDFGDGRASSFKENLQLVPGRETLEKKNLDERANLAQLFAPPLTPRKDESGYLQGSVQSTQGVDETTSTAVVEPVENSAKAVAEEQGTSTIPPTLMDRVNRDVKSIVGELFKLFRGPSSPSASSGSVVDFRSVIKNPIFPADIQQLKQYIRALKGIQDFSLARNLLSVVLQAEDKKWLEHGDWIKQQLAICTYKDEEIPSQKRLNLALAILEGIGLRDPDNNNSETLARGGAIYKRKWQTFGQLENLNEALFFYLAAYERNPEQDMGYGGVNAAFILDLLADRLKTIAFRSGAQVGEAERLQQKAADLRGRMATEIPNLASKLNATAPATNYLDNQFWFQVTMAEIHFGLKNYEEAGQWLKKANEINAWEWERETIFNQLVHIARLQGIVCPGELELNSDWHPAWRALSHILGEYTGRALANGRGKVGLALSGEGFRASFFHLGVMARLAEMDALRGVEVLSTVSGGSILGAHYYLELQNLLQTKPDKEITREDYIELVKRIQDQFVSGVQKNIRMRAYSNIRDNWRMLFHKNDYTRSHRLGELYESILYEQVRDGHDESAPRTMTDLLIKPADEPNPESFRPKSSNWRRRAKVPVLLLNSTSLNSGHNWQFTATWMGEPPGIVGGEIDVNERYRRVNYENAPTDNLKHYRLGHAVAASACVPGLFEPLSIEGLFAGRTVCLVDGGSHDSQGIAGLLDQGCTLILCSDASGKVGDVAAPSDDPGMVLLRTTSILQDRVRQSGYMDLLSRLDSRALQGLFFVHTKKELESATLDCINCTNPQSPSPLPDHLTSYDVARDLQEKIAAIRTDLDAFSEVEAYALMASGYLMTKREFNLLQEQHQKAGNPGTWGGYDIDAPCGDWPFSPLEPLLGSKPGANKQRANFEKQLKVASKTFFKTCNLIPFLKLMVFVLVTVIFLDINNMLTNLWSEFGHNLLSVVGIFIIIIIVAIFLFQLAFKWMFPQEEGRNLVIKVAISILGYILSKAYLGIFDSLFLARGKLKRLLNL